MESIRTQWLTQGLVLSVILNVGLLIVCIFYAFRQETIDMTGSFVVVEPKPQFEEPLARVEPLAHVEEPEVCEVAEADFSQSLEFLALEALFAESGADRAELLALAQETDWDAFSEFAEQLLEQEVVTSGQRRRFLVQQVEGGSALAADLLIRAEAGRAADFLDDAQVLQVLPALKSETREVRSFLTELLLSPRDPGVWEAAATTLYTFAGDELPLPYDHMTTLGRFVPDQILEMIPAQPHCHKVEQGESLWSIARSYKLSVGQIKEANELGSDAIYPGQVLTIPALAKG